MIWGWPARRPRAALGVAAIVTVVAAAATLRVSFRSDLTELVPTAVTSARGLRLFRELFADAEPVSALVEAEDPAVVEAAATRLALRLQTAPRVREAQDRLVDDVGRWDRIADLWRRLDADAVARAGERLREAEIEAAVGRARALLLAPGAGGIGDAVRADPLRLRDLLAGAYERLGAGLRVDPATRRFVTADGRAAVVLVRPRGSPFDARFVRALEGDLRRAAAGTDPHARVAWTGPHVVARDTERMIRGDLGRSSVLSGIAILTVLLLSFGRPRAVLLLAAPLALGALWTTGFASLALAGLSAISVGFAAIVLGLGDDASVHLLVAVSDHRRAGLGPREATERGLAEVGPAALAAASTAALAFAALGASSLRALRELGLLAAVGVVATFLVAWLVLGAVLSRAQRPVATRAGFLQDWLAHLGAWVAVRRRAVLLAAAAVVAVAGVLGLPALADRVVVVRPSRMPSLRTQDRLFETFGGTPGQWIALQRARSLDGALQASERLAWALGRMARQGTVAGFDTLSSVWPSGRAQAERLVRWKALGPADAALRLQAALVRHGFALRPFAPAIEALRTPDEAIVRPSPDSDLVVRRHLRIRAGLRKGRAVVATFVRPAEGADPERLASALRRAVPGVVLTGYPLLEHEVRRLLPKDLARVGGIALVLVLLALVLHYRRLRPVLVSFIGMWVGLSALVVVLHAAGVRWTAYNLIVLPVLVGISVDENVFLVERWQRSEGDAAMRTSAALAGAGRAIVTTSLTTLAGFGALAFCDFDGIRGMGVTAALGVAACLASSLLVTPALAAAMLPTPPPAQV